MDKLQKKINMKGYADKVPEKVRKENDDKLEGYKTEFQANEKSIQDLKQI